MASPTNCLKCEWHLFTYPLAFVTGIKEAKRITCWHQDAPHTNYMLVRVRARKAIPPGWCPLRKGDNDD